MKKRSYETYFPGYFCYTYYSVFIYNNKKKRKIKRITGLVFFFPLLSWVTIQVYFTCYFLLYYYLFYQTCIKAVFFFVIFIICMLLRISFVGWFINSCFCRKCLLWPFKVPSFTCYVTHTLWRIFTAANWSLNLLKDLG